MKPASLGQSSVALALLVMFSQSPMAYAQSTSCTDTIQFPGASLQEVLNTFRDPNTAPAFSELPLTDASVAFLPRNTGPTERSAVDMIITMHFDLQALTDKFQAETTQALTDNGCSHQSVHSFSFTPQDNSLLAKFHVKYVKRSCWWFFGDQTTDLGTVEADAWTRLSFSPSPDHRHVGLVTQSGGDDNVPQLVRSVASILANITSIIPGLNIIGVHLDAQMFQMLKTERDFLDGSLAGSYFQHSPLTQGASFGKTMLGTTTKVDLSFSEAHFTGVVNHPGLSMVVSTSREHPLSRSEVCTMKELLLEQQLQHEKLGGNGADYDVNPGDSLWRIARANYGSPSYMWLIADANGMSDDSMDGLVPGSRLHLPTFASYLYGTETHIVKNGESLWAVSRSAPTSSFDALKKSNNSRIGNLNRIYPGEILHFIGDSQHK